jgi:hypothetical protein
LSGRTIFVRRSQPPKLALKDKLELAFAPQIAADSLFFRTVVRTKRPLMHQGLRSMKNQTLIKKLLNLLNEAEDVQPSPAISQRRSRPEVKTLAETPVSMRAMADSPTAHLSK